MLNKITSIILYLIHESVLINFILLLYMNCHSWTASIHHWLLIRTWLKHCGTIWSLPQLRRGTILTTLSLLYALQTQLFSILTDWQTGWNYSIIINFTYLLFLYRNVLIFISISVLLTLYGHLMLYLVYSGASRCAHAHLINLVIAIICKA